MSRETINLVNEFKVNLANAICEVYGFDETNEHFVHAFVGSFELDTPISDNPPTTFGQVVSAQYQVYPELLNEYAALVLVIAAVYGEWAVQYEYMLTEWPTLLPYLSNRVRHAFGTSDVSMVKAPSRQPNAHIVYDTLRANGESHVQATVVMYLIAQDAYYGENVGESYMSYCGRHYTKFPMPEWSDEFEIEICADLRP